MRVPVTSRAPLSSERRLAARTRSETPLGSVEGGPQSLLTSVSTCLDCAFPIVLWWGPELPLLYTRNPSGPAFQDFNPVNVDGSKRRTVARRTPSSPV
jgi:hypothetical protein